MAGWSILVNVHSYVILLLMSCGTWHFFGAVLPASEMEYGSEWGLYYSS